MQTAKEKKWDKSTKAERRVMIAEDVIAQLKLQNIYAMKGKFIRWTGNPSDSTKLKGIFKGRTSCSACVKGALFITSMQYTNGMVMGDSNWLGDWRPDSSPMKKLSKIFTSLQLAYIETAFEKTAMDCNQDFVDWDSYLADKLVAFGHKYYKDEDRMVAIMENIIKNKGTFKV